MKNFIIGLFGSFFLLWITVTESGQSFLSIFTGKAIKIEEVRCDYLANYVKNQTFNDLWGNSYRPIDVQVTGLETRTERSLSCDLDVTFIDNLTSRIKANAYQISGGEIEISTQISFF